MKAEERRRGKENKREGRVDQVTFTTSMSTLSGSGFVNSRLAMNGTNICTVTATVFSSPRKS